LLLLLDAKTAAKTNTSVNESFLANAGIYSTENVIYKPTKLSNAVRASVSVVQPSQVAASNESSYLQAPRPYSREEVIALIETYSAEYGISSEAPLRIAKCESNYRWDAKNKRSSASGVFQYLAGTWANTYEGKAGLSVFDADANIRAAIRHMSVHGFDAWECK
jgi:hypothetical protein